MRISQTQRGFTLLEMLVSLGIFTIVAVVAVGSLVRIVSLNKQSQTLQTSVNSLSSALEAISREMRVGQLYDCVTSSVPINESEALLSVHWTTNDTPRSCNITNTSPASAVFSFASQRTKDKASGGGACQLKYAYWLNKDATSDIWTFKKAQQTNCENSAASFGSVLDEVNIILTGYKMGVYRPAGGYAWAFIRLKGYAGTRAQDQNFFDVQTSVSERMSD